MSSHDNVMEKLVSLAKRRGFVFQSSEIYGGLGSVWDYGPLGVELKKNIKERWWRSLVHERDDIEGLDAAILMHPKVWEASGHVAGFSDPLLDCKQCKNRSTAGNRRFKGDADLAVHDDKRRFHDHTGVELAHYAADAYDIQYEVPVGCQEFAGIHNRRNLDLSRHQACSGKKLEYVDAATDEGVI